MPDRSDNELPEPIRLSDTEVEELAATVARLTARTSAHDELFDRLAADEPLALTPPPSGSGSYIVGRRDRAYSMELGGLTTWVNEVLLPTYGREVSTQAPWCPWWPEHPEAVARLHGLWMAWKQHIAPDAGPSGPAVWHRDFLDHTMTQLRSPSGPFGACMTHPKRPAHRVLPPPLPQDGSPPRSGGVTE
ncbi:DUF4913 domain-containing protein [Streptomyces hainanensis]|uniref:DUF4913 domain-containing protein n=1 Tax=Streptomyces hainanensis TaxID=402648 RepID=A0A4R4T6R2_9ACTN|nr:DUF4913 domain-containing protein [Streptomyces hainanensis]TDC72617.1 DUF4913 domain-containing protein [Streptomyces hainanensis]